MKYNPSIVTAFFSSAGIPEPVYEHRFHPTRKWRFDIAWPDRKVAVEVNGGIWIGGGHNRGAQMLKDMEKANASAELNWRILYCQPKDLCTLEFASLVKRVLLLRS